MVAVTPSASGSEIVWSSAPGRTARGAVAVGEGVGGLGELVDALVLGLPVGSVLVELGKIRRVRHGPQGRT